MAIMSFIVNCDQVHVNEVITELKKMPTLELHGVHNGYQVVVVADMPSDSMEELMAQVRDIPFVQTCEVSYMNIEDELETS